MNTHFLKKRKPASIQEQIRELRKNPIKGDEEVVRRVCALSDTGIEVLCRTILLTRAWGVEFYGKDPMPNLPSMGAASDWRAEWKLLGKQAQPGRPPLTIEQVQTLTATISDFLTASTPVPEETFLAQLRAVLPGITNRPSQV